MKIKGTSKNSCLSFEAIFFPDTRPEGMPLALAKYSFNAAKLRFCCLVSEKNLHFKFSKWVFRSALKGFAMVLASLIISCNHSKTGLINNASALSNKERQYFSNGKGLYQRLCQNCHRDTGEGLGMLIPSLKNSDYLLKDVAGSAAVIRYGLKGPIVVNGKVYDQPMPPHSRLTPLEIAEILTYISNSWGNQHGGVTTEAVKKALEEVPHSDR